MHEIMKNIHIGPELESDYKGVYDLIKTSFATAEHSDGTEQDLVENLRKSKAYIPELALVAECDQRIVGYIMSCTTCSCPRFSKARRWLRVDK